MRSNTLIKKKNLFSLTFLISGLYSILEEKFKLILVTRQRHTFNIPITNKAAQFNQSSFNSKKSIASSHLPELFAIIVTDLYSLILSTQIIKQIFFIVH